MLKKVFLYLCHACRKSHKNILVKGFPKRLLSTPSLQAEGFSPEVTPFSFSPVGVSKKTIPQHYDLFAGIPLTTLWTLRTAHELGVIPSYLMQVGRTIGNELLKRFGKDCFKIDADKSWCI
jgi:hypothetical protein